MDWNSKIIGMETRNPSLLKMNSLNWKIHLDDQRESLNGLMKKIGWVNGVVVNKRSSDEWGEEKGVETIVDGHCRVEEAISNSEEEVPVVLVDLSPEEEKIILASFDPISALALEDTKTAELIRSSLNEFDNKLKIQLFGDGNEEVKEEAQKEAKEEVSDSECGEIIIIWKTQDDLARIQKITGLDISKKSYNIDDVYEVTKGKML
jgi:hypothetical protein